MAEFKFYTRGQLNPHGKPRVYFTAHPDDYDRYFDGIREEILSRQNCAIFYLEPGTDKREVEDYELKLSQMQLFVVPVTIKLLTTPNRAMDVDILYALAHHIPVLPLMQEGGLDEDFSRRFGNLQYLDKNNTDATAISYDEKLTKYLNGVIIGDELAAKVRAAFDAYIFLSYRKKDRRYAQNLMRLIHSNSLCRDIAIWYDEFLTPGEDFNDAIRDALEKSDLFALAVTPNLINETNYILTTEYPTAREMGKSILPVEMVRTGRFKLRLKYKKIPEPIPSTDRTALRERLIELLQKLAITTNDSDPMHNFFIGLAYLSGIDVEIDHTRAVELITGSAEVGCTEAIEKLISMYEIGEGVERDYHKAVEWRERLIVIRKEEYESDPTEDRAIAFLNAVWYCGDAYYDLRLLKKADEKYMELLNFSVSLSENYPRLRRSISASYERLGDIAMARGDLQRAEEYCLKDLEIVEALARELGTVESSRDLSACYCGLGDIAMANGDPLRAEEYYRKGLEIFEALVEETGTAESQRDLSASYDRCGNIAMANGDMSRAEEYYQKGLEIREALVEETGTVESRRHLSLSYNKIGDVAMSNGDLRKAERYYRKGLEIAKDVADETWTVDARRDLSVSYSRLAHITMSGGELRRAEEYCLKDLEIVEALAEETRTVEARRDLSLSYNRLGDIAMANGDLRNAEKYYLKELEIAEALAEETGTIEARRNLSVSYDRLGDIAMVNGDPHGAEEYYFECLEIFESLAEETETVEARHALTVIYDKLGNIAMAKGDLFSAEGYYRDALEIAEALVEKNGTIEARRDLSISYNMLGNIAMANRDLRRAEEYYLKGLEIVEVLAEETGTVEARRGLSVSYIKLGDTVRDSGDLCKAEEYYLKNLKITKALVEETGTIEARRDLSASYERLGNISNVNHNPCKAEENYLKCIEIREALLDETGTVNSYDDLAISYYKLGMMLSDKQRLNKARDIWLMLAESYPDVLSFRQRYDLVTRELNKH